MSNNAKAPMKLVNKEGTELHFGPEHIEGLIKNNGFNFQEYFPPSSSRMFCEENKKSLALTLAPVISFCALFIVAIVQLSTNKFLKEVFFVVCLFIIGIFCLTALLRFEKWRIALTGSVIGIVIMLIAGGEMTPKDLLELFNLVIDQLFREDP